MVINKNGNKEPANTGPEPSTNWVTAGILSSGAVITMPMASKTKTAAISTVLPGVKRARSSLSTSVKAEQYSSAVVLTSAVGTTKKLAVNVQRSKSW